MPLAAARAGGAAGRPQRRRRAPARSSSGRRAAAAGARLDLAPLDARRDPRPDPPLRDLGRLGYLSRLERRQRREQAPAEGRATGARAGQRPAPLQLDDDPPARHRPRYGQRRSGRSTDQHSDSIMLLRTDPGRHRLVYLSIPRDLRTAIPGLRRPEDQRGDAVRRAEARGAHRSTRSSASAAGQPRRDRRLQPVREADRRGRRDHVNVPENILSNRFDCPFPTQRVPPVAGLALPQGLRRT